MARALTCLLALAATLALSSIAARADLIGNPQLPPYARTGTPPNVMLVLDHSGSMNSGAGSRWEKAKATLVSILQTYGDSGIRFGLMRMDGSNHDGTDGKVDGTQTIVRNGGRILKPCGTAPQAIIDYIQSWASSNQPQTWTNLAETLADAGRYFATVAEATPTNGVRRVAKGPSELGVYAKNYTFQTAGQDLDATAYDDRGNPIDTTSPIQAFCQKSFLIFITDGYATYDNDWPLVTDTLNRAALAGDVDEGDVFFSGDANDGCPAGGCTYFDDVADYLFKADLRSDLAGVQNLVTHVIGFDISDNSNLLAHTATAGGGKYFSAVKGDDSLKSALDEIIQDILATVASGTAVGSASKSQSEKYLLLSRFNPRERTGDLAAYALPVPENPPPGYGPDWSAATLLAARNPASRKIFTRVTDANGARAKAPLTAANPAQAYLSSALGLGTADTVSLIGAIRAQPLGTIIHSTPVTVGPPKFFHTDKGYRLFRNRWKNRPTLIYTGANDGMLHAFYAFTDSGAQQQTPNWSGGEEAWAYIPQAVHAQLPGLTGVGHKYLVDLQVSANDVWDTNWDTRKNDATADDPDPNGDGWKTVLVGGSRLGGESYFALDVTNPSADGFQVLWEAAPHPGAKASTRPAIGQVRHDNRDQWIALFSSGYREDTGPGGICALAIADGSRLPLWSDAAGQPTATLTTQPRTVNVDAPPYYYTMSDPVALDSDGDGNLDLIYVGDSEGVLWKIHYDFVEKKWKKNARFFTGGAPITGKPALAFDRQRNLRVFFGTGSYLVDVDKRDTRQNSFFGIIERPQKTPADQIPAGQKADANEGRYVTAPASPETKADLLNVTHRTRRDDFLNLSETQKEALSERGWSFDLDLPVGPAQRVTGHPLVLAGVVFFTAFTPNDNLCEFGGESRLYAVSYDRGLQARLFDLETMPTVLKDDNGGDLPTGQRYGELGPGIASDPLWHFDGRSKLYIDSSDGDENGAPLQQLIQLPGRPMSLQGWRELEN